MRRFREGSRVRQTPEEGRRTYRPKRCGNNNKDEDNSPKTLNDKKEIVRFSLILWHINTVGLFNVKSCLYLVFNQVICLLIYF